MFGTGKCPKCGDTVMRCDLDKIIIGNQGLGPFFHGISANCPKCKTVLGVSIDPVSLAEDIASEVVQRIGKRTR
jgi:phage FluMu protein Com